MLLEKIEIIEKRYDEIYQMISNPDIIADQKKYIQIIQKIMSEPNNLDCFSLSS